MSPLKPKHFQVTVLIRYGDEDQTTIKVLQSALTAELALVRVGTRIGRKFKEAKIIEATVFEATTKSMRRTVDV